MTGHGNAWPGLHAAGLADVDQIAETRRPSAFFTALDQADKKIADDQVQAVVFLAAIRTYECVCGAECEFTEDSNLTDFAALNSWLGHHNRCAEFRELEDTGMALVGTVRHLTPSSAPSPTVPPAACASGD